MPTGMLKLLRKRKRKNFTEIKLDKELMNSWETGLRQKQPTTRMTKLVRSLSSMLSRKTYQQEQAQRAQDNAVYQAQIDSIQKAVSKAPLG